MTDTAPPTDIVDRVTNPGPTHGFTAHETIDAFLDELNRLGRDRQHALDALHDFIRHHPDHEPDVDLNRAMLALLR